MNDGGPPGLEIVKVRLPHFPPWGQVATIYDQRRKHRQARKLTEIERDDMGGQRTRYFEAWWSEATGWVLFRPTMWRHW